MLEFDFLKLIAEPVKNYKEFPLPAIITDLEFTVYWSNSLAKDLFGYLADTQNLRGVLSEFDTERLVEDVRERGSHTIEDVVPFSGVRMSALPARHQGAHIGYVLLLMGADTLLGTRSFFQTAKTANALATGLQKAVGDMFGAMDVAALKAEAFGAGWVKASYSRISYSCYRILRISNNIAMFSKYQSGNLNLTLGTVDLFALLREWSETVALTAGSMGVPVAFDIPREAGGVRLDTRHFELVFFNILHNALYFTRPGNRVVVRARREGAALVVEVEDRGTGIPAEVAPHVFRPYVSHDASGQNPTVGLGLTLCKILMEAHDGAASIRSRPGEGTVVSLRFIQNDFGGGAPLAQSVDRYVLSDRFSSVYTGLMDAAISPYRGGE